MACLVVVEKMHHCGCDCPLPNNMILLSELCLNCQNWLVIIILFYSTMFPTVSLVQHCYTGNQNKINYLMYNQIHT